MLIKPEITSLESNVLFMYDLVDCTIAINDIVGRGVGIGVLKGINCTDTCALNIVNYDVCNRTVILSVGGTIVIGGEVITGSVRSRHKITVVLGRVQDTIDGPWIICFAIIATSHRKICYLYRIIVQWCCGCISWHRLRFYRDNFTALGLCTETIL